EDELDELLYAPASLPGAAAPGRPVLAVSPGYPGPPVANGTLEAAGSGGLARLAPGPEGRHIQLSLREAPPVRLAAPPPLFPDYEDGTAFYRYYGNAGLPRLPWEDPARLETIARALDARVAELRAREARLRTGRTVLAGPVLGDRPPDDYETLVEV